MLVQALQDKKGLDILVMDMRQINDSSDYFILCSATSDVHVKTLTDGLVEKAKSEGLNPWHLEGNQTRRWVLVDFVDIVVHIMRQEAREFYALERLWGDAETTSYEDTWELPSPLSTPN